MMTFVDNGDDVQTISVPAEIKMRKILDALMARLTEVDLKGSPPVPEQKPRPPKLKPKVDLPVILADQDQLSRPERYGL